MILDSKIKLATPASLPVDGVTGEFSEIRMVNLSISETTMAFTVVPYAAQSILNGGNSVNLAELTNDEQATMATAWEIAKRQASARAQ